MSDSNDHFARLEEKLLRAVELFKQTQADRRALQQEVEKLKVEFKEQNRRTDTLERDVQALRREREEVRSRIEKLIEQIDVLTKSDSAG